MPTTLDPTPAIRAPWQHTLNRLSNPLAVDEAIAEAGLDWQVDLRPLFAGEGEQVRVKDRYVVCRLDKAEDDPSAVMGLVGRDYTPIQNRDAFSFLDPLLSKGSAEVVAAGAQRGGKRVYMQVKLPGEIRVTPDDVIHKYLLLSNSHDGTSAVRAGVTPIRLACSNALAVMIKNMGSISIRHYPDVVDQVKQATHLLSLVEQAYDKAEEMMQAMARTPMDDRSAMQYFKSVLPDPYDAEEAERERLDQRRQRWMELYEFGDGNQMQGVRGTAYAGLQGIVQWCDRESYTERNKEPINTVFFGTAERIKRRAFEEAGRLAHVYMN